MNHVKLDIELERQPARFHPGEPIRGVVHARSAKPFECGRLGLTWTRVLYPRLPGKPTNETMDIALDALGVGPCGPRPDRQVVGRLALEQNDRTPREEHHLAFEFAAPAGPFSYDGEFFRTQWSVSTMHGLLPWNDTKTLFDLFPWMPGERPEHNSAYRAQLLGPPDAYDFGSPSDARRYLAASPALPLLSRTKNTWARIKAGAMRLECPSTIAAGEQLTVRVHFPRGARSRIGQVEVRLAGVERFGSGRAHALRLAPDSLVTGRTAALQIADAEPEPGFVDGATDVWSATLERPAGRAAVTAHVHGLVVLARRSALPLEVRA